MSKIVKCLFAISVFCSVCGTVSAKHVKVYLIAGQSNAAGAGFNVEYSAKYQNPQNDIEFWNGGRLPNDGFASYKCDRDAYTEFGPLELGSGNNLYATQSGFEMSLGRMLKDSQPDSNIAIIKYGVSGSALQRGLRPDGAGDWDPEDKPLNDPFDGIRYRIFKHSAVTPGLKAITDRGDTYSIEALFWMQGETDAGNSNAANNYEANLRKLVQAVRADFNCPQMKFIIGRLRSAIDRPYLSTVRDAMQRVADSEPYVYVVNTDDIALNDDDLHFCSAGLELLGERFTDVYFGEDSGSTEILDGAGMLNASFTDLHSWYKADSDVVTQSGTFNDGDAVVNWKNSQGNASRDLNEVFGPGSVSPTVKLNAINGKPAVSFNNSKGIRQTQTNWGTLADGVTVFAVVQHDNIKATDYIFDSANIDNRNILCSLGSSRKWAINGGRQIATGDMKSCQFLVHEIVFNGADSKHFVDGQLVGEGDAGVKLFSGLTLGTHVLGGGNSFDGLIAEFVVYKSPLGDADRESVRNYLNKKYALSFFCGDPDLGYPVMDLDQNCEIDLNDFSVLASSWLNSESTVNLDYQNAMDEFVALANSWLGCTDPIDPDCVLYAPFINETVDVFWRGMNGVNTYRIPTAVTTQNGVVLAFCEARKNSPADMTPTMLVLRRSLDRGLTWKDMQVLVDVGDDAAMDPTALVDQITGKVWLFYEVFPSTWRDNPVPGFEYPSCLQYCIYSDDDGLSWSEPIDITSQIKDAGWYGVVFGPGIGVQIANDNNKGRLVIPAHYSHGNFVIYSDDNGDSWTRAGGMVSNLAKGIECQIVELECGDYLMNIRNQFGGCRMISRSPFGGDYWSPAVEDDELLDPICQASLMRYSWESEGENAILFSNPSNPNSRVNMTVQMSFDDCTTWPTSRSIYAGPSGYSCLTTLRDKSAGCLFEKGLNLYYEKISFVRFNYAWLIN